jgi:ATP-binding cassette subfamily B protein
VGDHLQHVLNTKAAELDAEYFESPEYYTALHRAQQEAPLRAMSLQASLLQVGRSGAALVAIAGFLLVFNWWVALGLIIGELAGSLVRIRGALEQYLWYRQTNRDEMRARYFSSLLTAGTFIPEIRLFGLGGLFVDRARRLRERLQRERKRIVLRRMWADIVTQVCAVAAVYGAFGYVAYQTLTGSITLGDLVMYFAAFQRSQGYLHEILTGLASFYEDNLFLSHISEFLALAPTVRQPAKPVPVPRPLRTGIALEHVDFRYPGTDRLVLEDVCLTVRPGERIAIVGPNGSGKTTLIKLIARLYDPTAGRILADGIPLSDFVKEDWYSQIGTLFQESGRYSLSVRENIWLGNMTCPLDDPAIVEAARRTGAHEVIEKLPDGYDTLLRRVLDDGAELSIGEWQRLGLARAYLRDAQVMILDEPTSALDPVAESELLATFWQAAQDRITVVISHRLSTVRMADRIYVLVDGRIVESGSHDQLMGQRGIYEELFVTQARYYQ